MPRGRHECDQPHLVRLAELRFLDWASMMIHGYLPVTVAQALFSLLIQLLFAGTLGAVFAFLVLGIGRQNLLLRGIIYSWAVWFTTFTIALLFKVPHLTIIGLDTSVSKLVSVALYGLTLAATLEWLERRVQPPA